MRRARLLLGTLVEAGVVERCEAPSPAPALERAFAAIAEVERELSAFNPSSDIGRFNQAARGETLAVGPHTLAVLTVARELFEETGGLFDVAQGTGEWLLSGSELRKLSAGVRIDPGGIGKGYAVDRAFEVLQAEGLPCWVNAGGDLRVTGVDVPVVLRDEACGGARPWMLLREGALATSCFTRGARSRLSGAARARHVSVAAPRCIHSDALTKVVARSGQVDHPVLARHGATAWVHEARR
jgi:thiamine biosynthesis lipoprotein